MGEYLNYLQGIDSPKLVIGNIVFDMTEVPALNAIMNNALKAIEQYGADKEQLMEHLKPENVVPKDLVFEYDAEKAGAALRKIVNQIIEEKMEHNDEELEKCLRLDSHLPWTRDQRNYDRMISAWKTPHGPMRLRLRDRVLWEYWGRGELFQRR